MARRPLVSIIAIGALLALSAGAWWWQRGGGATGAGPQPGKECTEFWPIYLRAHNVPLCRALHYGASICGLAALALVFATGNLWWLAFGLVGSYAFAWAGHFKVENNVPLTFKHPLWSLIADYRMFFLWASGRLGQHLAAAGVTART